MRIMLVANNALLRYYDVRIDGQSIFIEYINQQMFIS